MDDDKSRVISLTVLRLASGIFSSTAMTVSAFCAAYGSYKCASASVSVTVGHKSIEFPAAERRLVDGQIWSDIMRIDNIFFCVIKLPPAPVVAEYFLVLS